MYIFCSRREQCHGVSNVTTAMFPRADASLAGSQSWSVKHRADVVMANITTLGDCHWISLII